MYKTYELPKRPAHCVRIYRLRPFRFGRRFVNGSRHEPQELSGISHFIEHMLFKGTQNRSALAIAEENRHSRRKSERLYDKEYTCFLREDAR